jgi:polar amino acid transport system ATP-binding protein
VGTPVVEVRGLRRAYPLAEEPVIALSGVDLTIESGEFVAVMGPSGSGKSTFMHIVGFLDRPTSGTYRFDGRDVTELVEDDLADIRSRRLGFVFQAYNLLPRTTALENVELPMLYAGIPEAERRSAALAALDEVGLAKYASHRPNQLSGGQQQRVAIVRSLAMGPRLLLLDEVTSALDPELVAEVLDLVGDLARQGMTMLIATHEMGFARDVANTICFLEDGVIVESGPPERIFGDPTEPATRRFLQSIVNAGRL